MFAFSLFVEAVALWYWMFLCSFPKLLRLRFWNNLDFGFLNKPVTLFQSILYVDMLAPMVKGQLLFLSCHFLCHRYSLDPRPNQITSTCWGQLKMTSGMMGSSSLVRYVKFLIHFLGWQGLTVHTEAKRYKLLSTFAWQKCPFLLSIPPLPP